MMRLLAYQAVVWRTGSVAHFFADVTASARRLFPHRRQKLMQREAFVELISNLEDGHIYMLTL